MNNDYVPKREAELRDYAANFAALTSAAPASYALTAGDAAQISQVVQDFVTSYELLQSPHTRTSPNVAAKDGAKATLISVLRGYAMQIKANRAVEDSAKVALKLKAQDAVRTRGTAPVTFPMLKIASATPRCHRLCWNDSETPESRAKPARVQGLVLYCTVGTTPPEEALSGRFKALITRQPYRMEFSQGDIGKTAYYWARWQTPTGLMSKWSQMVSMGITG